MTFVVVLDTPIVVSLGGVTLIIGLRGICNTLFRLPLIRGI